MKKIFITSLAVIFCITLTTAQTHTINSGTTGTFDFDASGGGGTLVISPGVTATLSFQIWGGGGGGSTQLSGAGGGGGGFTSVASFSLGEGNYTVVVGSGGSAGNPGGSSSINGSSAGGGGAGSGATAGSGGTGTYAGGNGGVGTGAGNGSGAGGGGSCSTTAGGNGGAAINGNNKAGGAGGTGCSGTGGVGGTSSGGSAVNGGDGSGIGGGGGAGNDIAGATGGTGADGLVRVIVTVAVPVTFSYFEVEDNMLSWQTASERNNDRFEVERKVDGSNQFELIGVVKGMGWSDELIDYQFVDKTRTVRANVCYRLKQVDYDGNFEYSDAVCSSTEETQPLEVFPNPFKDELYVQGLDADKQTNIKLLSVYGEVLLSKESDFQSQVKLNTSMLEPGTYFIRVSGEAHKIIKR